MIEYIILGVLGFIVLLLLILILRSKSNHTEELLRQTKDGERTMLKDIQNINTEMKMNMMELQGNIIQKNNEANKNQLEALYKANKEITQDFMKFEAQITRKIDLKINELNERVTIRLDENFKKTNETFTHIVERISKIDEAQKKIEELSSNIISLEDVLTDKKSRGTFGEVGLYQILSAVFGEKNDNVYKMQYTLPNGCICDSILFTPSPLGNLCIDSKFPLENYRRLMERHENKEAAKVFEKAFEADMKKHIDAIASKYIIRNITADQAVLFLPSEAIFAQLNAYHTSIIDYAYRKRVWITSPTTIMAFLTTLQMMLRNLERNKYSKIIQEELEKLAIEFSRYKFRFTKLKKDISTISHDIEDISITTEKITNKFEKISQVTFDTKEVEMK